MRINLYATLRLAVGKKSIDMDLPQPATVQELLQVVTQTYPQLGALLLDDAGQLLAHIHIMINGHDLQHLPDGMHTPLTSFDNIDIFPPVAGGSYGSMDGSGGYTT